MSQILETVLLMALPASGKSEVRHYLEHMPVEKRISDFHMGHTVQLDDYPYVHIMRCIDEEIGAKNADPIFFYSIERPFISSLEWGTLVELLNQDYADVTSDANLVFDNPGESMLDRFDDAAEKVGLPRRFEALDPSLRKAVADKIQTESRDQFATLVKLREEGLKGNSLVIEFARGGPDGSDMPLPEGHGYNYSLPLLSDAILSKAKILYVWVTPEESRRKNEARADPNDPGSILNHGVPIEVMMNEYGCDDLSWLEENSEKPGTVTVKAHGKTYYLPVGRFDNRVDKTSFLRANPGEWAKEDIKAVHAGLKEALDKLV